MTSITERKVNIQVMYRIGEFASLVGVSTVTLRHWERDGILIPCGKSEGKHRYYSQEQLAHVLANGGRKFVRGRLREEVVACMVKNDS